MKALRTRIDKLRPPEIQKPWISVIRTVTEDSWHRAEDENKTPITDEEMARLEQQYNLIQIIVHTVPPSRYSER